MLKIKLLLVTTVFAIVTLFVSTEALSATDCSGGNNTCVDFSKGYKVYIGPNWNTVSADGWLISQYLVEKKKSSNLNQLLFEIESLLQIGNQSNYQDLLAPGVADSATGLGGQRFYQVVRYSPNFATGLAEVLIYTRPVIQDPNARYTLGQAAVKGGSASEVELGNILLPVGTTAASIETTMVEVTGDQGETLRVEFDRNGNCVNVYVNDISIGCESGFDLSETYYCVPAPVGSEAPNTTMYDLIANPEDPLVYCGNVLFNTNLSDIQFRPPDEPNNKKCKTIGGKEYCY